MKQTFALILTLALTSVFFTQSTLAETADKDTESKPTETSSVWDLDDLYPDITSWDEARNEIATRITTLDECEGKLGDSAEMLGQCMDDISKAYKDLLQLYVYAYLAKDTDLGNSEFRERSSLAQTLLTQLEETTSYINPELVAIGKEKLHHFLKSSDTLKDHDFSILNTLRQAEHILSPEEERIIAASSDALSTASNAYEILTNAEIPWPEITLSDGEKIRLDASGYGQARTSAIREDRKAVFQAFWETFQGYRQTLAITLEGQVKNDVLIAKLRGFDSSLQRALADDNIPEGVYRALVTTVDDKIESLHRFIALRQRMLKINETHYYDVYPSVISLDKHYSLEETKNLTIEALQPLGKDYIDTFTEAVNKNWMHVYPIPGKRSGAYVMGAAYDIHPYVLLNFDNTLESVSTFVHEWGHAMHSLLANQNQPYSKAGYATFIAEIASTANEVLLFDYLRKNAANDQERLYYLFKELSQIRGTFFRQTQFAEFELAIHEEVENGGALSGDKLNTMYGDILKRYYGHDKGIMNIDELYTVEWAFVPHFYRNFYVYQYATSISAAYYLTDKILRDGEVAQHNFLNILRAGGSDYPYNILLNAGVDMASPEVYEAVIRRMNTLMDEVETILDKQA
tara:strand:- start:50966 stop:52858 length:1893 start_codon:yes stop_codon:yes gene_type:complete